MEHILRTQLHTKYLITFFFLNKVKWQGTMESYENLNKITLTSYPYTLISTKHGLLITCLFVTYPFYFFFLNYRSFLSHLVLDTGMVFKVEKITQKNALLKYICRLTSSLQRAKHLSIFSTLNTVEFCKIIQKSVACDTKYM